jgi:uncharacterized lipoprotein
MLRILEILKGDFMKYILLSLVMVMLSACTNLKQTMGWSSSVPNEAEVQVIKPLEVPKKFDLPQPSEPTIIHTLKTSSKAPVSEANSDLIHRKK